MLLVRTSRKEPLARDTEGDWKCSDDVTIIWLMGFLANFFVPIRKLKSRHYSKRRISSSLSLSLYQLIVSYESRRDANVPVNGLLISIAFHRIVHGVHHRVGSWGDGRVHWGVEIVRSKSADTRARTRVRQRVAPRRTIAVAVLKFEHYLLKPIDFRVFFLTSASWFHPFKVMTSLKYWFLVVFIVAAWFSFWNRNPKSQQFSHFLSYILKMSAISSRLAAANLGPIGKELDLR